MEALTVDIDQEGQKPRPQETGNSSGDQVDGGERSTVLVLIKTRCRENDGYFVAVSSLSAVPQTGRASLSSTHPTPHLQTRVIAGGPQRPGHPATFPISQLLTVRLLPLHHLLPPQHTAIIAGVCVAQRLLSVEAQADFPSVSGRRAVTGASPLVVTPPTAH